MSLLVALAVSLWPARTHAYVVGDDLPAPPAQLETIPAGSLVIPMDNTLQALVTPFNLKAYGLANNLLQNGIPLKWVIKAGKAKDAVDFTATAQRIAPSTTAGALLSFSGGPFIVHRDFAQLARTRITAFGGNVAVYELTADAVGVDVRYDLTLKPKIAVSNVNTGLHSDTLDEAGIPGYTVVDPTTLSAASCYTSHSEPHTSATAGVDEVKLFVQSGANFMAQCHAVESVENVATGRFQSTLGFVTDNDNTVVSYPNPDLAFSQYVGALAASPGGSVQDWRLAASSVFQNNTHIHGDNVGSSPATWAATAAKLRAGKGGMVFYLGGHDYNGSSALGDVNGRRMYLNFLFVPTERPAACALDFELSLRTISGTVYEDPNADSGLGDAVGRPGVRVRLYTDPNNNGIVDAGDVFVSETTTGAGGAYSFQVSTAASGSRYLVATDSKSVTPSAGLTGGATQGDVWAEQTLGDDPTTAALDVSRRFGGRSAGLSDNFATSTAFASNAYEHLARLDVTAASVAGVDFAFSFNVVTNLLAGGSQDDDASANRTVQGSFRQYLQNARAVTGPNVMRFVPVVATNASGGGGSWWSLGVTLALPTLTDSDTTIDGRAYSSTDGVTVRNDNPGTLGAGGSVGVDALALAAVERPELEIQDVRSTAVVNIGLDVLASNAVLRRVALFGFGNAPASTSHANLRLGSSASGFLLEASIVGAGAASFTDPGAATRSNCNCIVSNGADTGTARTSLVGFCAGAGLSLTAGSNGWLVEGNEIRGTGITSATTDGVQIENASGGDTVRGNLIVDNAGVGVDAVGDAGAHTIRNNTITGNGVGAAPVETAGLRLDAAGTTADRNVIRANYGAGIQVWPGASGHVLSQNSVYDNGTITNRAGNPATGQIGIDLQTAGDAPGGGTAPFVTLNDSGDADAGANTLLNDPVIVTAVLAGPNLAVSGFARPGSTLEFFVADGDPRGFGEGKTYLFTAVEGAAGDFDAGSGTYGPGPVNGIAQGTDTTNRFAFSIPVPPGVGLGTLLTATARDASGNTSEFSGQVAVSRLAVVKRSFLSDGTPVASGVVLPRGTPIKFMLYVNNPGAPLFDVSLRDVLDVAFAYSSPSIKVDSSVTDCGTVCDATEEAAVFAAVNAAATLTDAAGPADVASYTAGTRTIDAGNQSQATNQQLDVPAGKVFAVLFTVTMQ